MPLPDRPNFLFFMPETVRADAVFSDARATARTPVIDRLAAEGARFDNAFVQMAYCTPSRISMFTGLYPHTSGHRSLFYLLRPYERNLFQDLKEAGYTTAVFGKNDLLAQESVAQSFDVREPTVRPDWKGMPNPWQPGDPHELSFYFGCREGTDCHDGDWACVQSALEFLDRDHDRPFCLFLPLSFAHPPYQVEEPWFSMHDRAELPAPIPREFAGKRRYVQMIHEVQKHERLGEADFREIKGCYYGMISRLDHQLGQLVDRLKARGLYDNTVICVFSDHGDYAGDYGLSEKWQCAFEDCMVHTPLVLRVPGCGPVAPRRALVEMVDLYPTVLELAGVEPKHYQFGRSLVPLLRGATDALRDAVFAEGGYLLDEAHGFTPVTPGLYGGRTQWRYDDPLVIAKAIMVRTPHYKYVYCPDDRDELYDLERDPDELHNIVEQPDAQTVRTDLRARILEWLTRTADTVPFGRDKRGFR